MAAKTCRKIDRAFIAGLPGSRSGRVKGIEFQLESDLEGESGTCESIVYVAAAAALAVALGSGPVAAEQFISIGTGGVTGVYYPTGGAICRLVNKMRKETGIRCSAESTGGSVYNINTLRAGGARVRGRTVRLAVPRLPGHLEVRGELVAFEGLRAVFSVHPEPVTIIARDDSGISNITDFKGKRVNIGNVGSGQRGTWDVIEEAMGWERSDLKLASELKSSEMGMAVCDNKIDAYFWLVGHPSAATQESLATCATHLVPAVAPEIDKLVAERPYYRTATIPAGMYNNQEDVKTFGVGATFVSSTDVPDEVVYTVVKAVFENFDQFKKLHPAFGNLKEAEMIMDSLSAPLHPGAKKYYEERGWM